jgi:hypothetical protein
VSDRDHAGIEELLAARALDGLDPADEAALDAELTAHGDCAACHALQAEFAGTAALLAVSLDPVPADPAIAERILATPRGAEASAVGAGAAPDELASRRGRRRARWPALVAVAAGFVLLVGGLAAVTRGTQPVTGTNWAQEVVTFEGAAGGSLAMAYVPGVPGAAFWGHGLPDPGEGMTYEIWMIDDGTPIPGGCVTPVDGRIAVFVNADVGTTEQMAVTVEPSACPPTPSGEPVLTAPLA